jgi:hypothetical protein
MSTDTPEKSAWCWERHPVFGLLCGHRADHSGPHERDSQAQGLLRWTTAEGEPSEAAQEGFEAAEQAWREYREASSNADGRLTLAFREPFIAGYLAALPEDNG